MKARRKEVEVAKKVLAAEAKRDGLSVRSGPKVGRPKEPASARKIAERTGISKGQQIRDTRHNELCARLPLLRHRRWSQRDALRLGELVDALPKKPIDDRHGQDHDDYPEAGSSTS